MDAGGEAFEHDLVAIGRDRRGEEPIARADAHELAGLVARVGAIVVRECDRCLGRARPHRAVAIDGEITPRAAANRTVLDRVTRPARVNTSTGIVGELASRAVGRDQGEPAQLRTGDEQLATIGREARSEEITASDGTRIDQTVGTRLAHHGEAEHSQRDTGQAAHAPPVCNVRAPIETPMFQ